MPGGVIALLCAVPAEERILRGLAGPGVLLMVTGMGALPAERRATEAIAAGARAALSVGFCGSLSPSLARGDVVVPDRVTDAMTGEAWQCDPALTRGVHGHRGTLVTVARVVADPAARAHLDGIAVDMESAGAARACARAGVPFAAIRAVSDRQGDVLPDLAGLIDPAGRVRARRIAGRIASRPAEFPAWVRLARGARAAGRALVPAVSAALAEAA